MQQWRPSTAINEWLNKYTKKQKWKGSSSQLPQGKLWSGGSLFITLGGASSSNGGQPGSCPHMCGNPQKNSEWLKGQTGPLSTAIHSTHPSPRKIQIHTHPLMDMDRPRWDCGSHNLWENDKSLPLIPAQDSLKDISLPENINMSIPTVQRNTEVNLVHT